MESPERDVGTEVNSLITLFFVDRKQYYEEIHKYEDADILDSAIQTGAGVVSVLAYLKRVKPLVMWQKILLEYALLGVKDEKFCE